MIQIVNSRRHIDAMGKECSSNNHYGVQDCGKNRNGHRCNGPHGGHPDIVAWDVIEAIYNLELDNPESKAQ